MEEGRIVVSVSQAVDLRAAFAEYHATRDPELRNELVNAFRPLAFRLARRHTRNREHQDDLVQAASVGLIKAVDRFDPTRGNEFSTFAWATIQGELKRHYRDRTWLVRPPRNLQERFLAVSGAIDELTGELGRSPTISEVGQCLELTEEDVIEAIEVRQAYLPSSLDAPAVLDAEPAPQLAADEDGYEYVDDRAMLTPLVARLPALEQRIIHLRFVGELSQSQIGEELGISQMQVSRLLARSLGCLRRWIASEAAHP
ncbi:MAG TPA: sigma-70 family RNA polymerase sigma factor [Acidimicrobiales bacterium]|nr:sigma-70 family RNA polymerase sigma factor [Acidimicrobiales bacterium]